MPMLVGITGGIGSGKSLVARIFRILGAPVYDADSRAKALMATSPNLRSAIVVLFGEESFSDNELNRQHIASRAFHEPKLLSQLNQLVHPAVQEDFERWSKEHDEHPYLIKEAALLVETGSYKKLDKLILVTSPENVRLQRVLQRDQHRTTEDISAIMSRQKTDDEKESLADVILRNDGSEMLLPRVIKLHEEFSKY